MYESAWTGDLKNAGIIQKINKEWVEITGMYILNRGEKTTFRNLERKLKIKQTALDPAYTVKISYPEQRHKHLFKIY